MLTFANAPTFSLNDLSLAGANAARRSREDPNDCAEFAFVDGAGRPIRQAPVHRALQHFLSNHSRALVELPRDHGKSAQVCIRALWELGRRPWLRIKIVCASEALAAERTRFLRDAIAGNGRLRQVFPRLTPATPWRFDRFSIRRPANVIGPSVTAFGIGAASTGTRADLLICDDIVDVRSIYSESERNRVKAYFYENLMNLLEPDGRLWCLFTPWHVNDLNAELKNNGAFALFRRAIDEHLTPIWPEKWSADRLADRRAEIGEISFARAYRLQPLSGAESLIRPEWIRYFRQPAAYECVALSIDPAVSAKPTSDATGLVVLGRTADGAIDCLAAHSRRVPLALLPDLIAELDRRWRLDVILFEANSAFHVVCDGLKRDPRFAGRVVAVTQTSEKHLRVHKFSFSVQRGEFRLYGGDGRPAPEQQALHDEMLAFPAGAQDDLLDAAATGTHFLLRPEPRILG